MHIINKNIQTINELCRKYKVKELYAFGSVVDDKKFNEKSDVDLVVEFGSVALMEYSDNYFSLASALEKTFHRKVDLISQKSLRNPVFIRVINRTKVPVFKA